MQCQVVLACKVSHVDVTWKGRKLSGTNAPMTPLCVPIRVLYGPYGKWGRGDDYYFSWASELVHFLIQS